MMLTRRFRGFLFSKESRNQNIVINKEGRVFYDVPAFHPDNKFSYRINEDVPKDAIPFPLDNISIKHHNDTPEFNKIPKLHHGLNRLLDGKIYMGDMGFGQFPHVDKQIIAQMSDYVPPSQDKNLIAITRQYKCKYSSSTSNISIPFSHLYFIFSMFRRPNFEGVYEQDKFDDIKKEYMNHFKKPVTFFLTKKFRENQLIYSIDADKGYSEEKTNEVLLQTGTLAEYLLTHSPETIDKILKTKTVEQKLDNYFRYCVINKNLILRSQIDCRDIDQDGNPFVFQIKTRACCPIRYDVENWKLYKDYPITKMRGHFQSFQREYYDLIRGAFLKYAFQLQIGRMNGAFVAYHNTENIYGYQYISFKEIVLRLFGNSYNLQITFGIISKMLTEIFDYIIGDTKQYDYNQLKVGFYANSVTKSLIVLVQVMSETKEYPSTTTNTGIDQYFFKNVKELKNPVFKYEFSFYTFLNGVLIRYPEIYYSPSDNIKMQWKVKKMGRIQKEQYITFLREAYKQDFVFGSNRYYGTWVDSGQIKEWN